MTDTTTLDAPAATTPRRSGSLTAMRLAELQGLASSMGISGTAKMRKGDLVAAIKARQNGESGPAAASEPAPAEAPASAESAESSTSESQAPARTRSRRASSSGQGAPQRAQDDARAERKDQQDRPERRDDAANESAKTNANDTGDARTDRARAERRDREQGDSNQGDRNQGDRGPRDGAQGDRNQSQQGQQGQQAQQSGDGTGEDDETGRSGRRRRNRNRNRDRDKRRPVGQGGETQHENEPQIAEDDILVPVAGILDILDNYAFVRTSGYLPGTNDVYVPLGMVKRHGLRKGDAVVGATKAPREGEEIQQQSVGSRNNRQKYTPLARLDSINGMTADDARKRAEFGKLTPLYPQDRLRLETDPGLLTTRIIDLVAPIGKGQRGLIVAPAKAGKTMVMQAVANAITTNNPEVHLMVVLVDERPEEVTDMQRAVKGEVIASTFDRPAEDHTTVAELAIERAKRLVEMGHDVVVLLDSITKLGRAYNLSAPASGRILSGGVDSAALYPPKKFFGAARNIEDGGSLTILATALVETGSRMDEVIFEEFKGTGNMELKLDRGLSNRRIFPAVDVNNSGTRREEILLAPEELKIMWKLRRVLGALDSQQAIELLLDRLRKTKTNYEFLVQVQQNSSIRLEDEDDDA
ncbi:transcription termination factor Rho [Knoellia subterranea]|uniref:Transcription termination factor Rho n=1 Tax=Knoellia subterranea KCTC 19937 TaxID=1385521 RepID=A0A0A0JQ85_9MICO|nr:transcription termination factor Rho [Knoellia subterranea]KGN39333.1 transcription termination factor Rho [Knoellia subterranea KCTC 19937]